MTPRPVACAAHGMRPMAYRHTDYQNEMKETKSMKQGSVKWYDANKGYGFIAPDDGPDIFVHYSDIAEDTLMADERVVFDIEQTDKGPRAVAVTLYREE